MLLEGTGHVGGVEEFIVDGGAAKPAAPGGGGKLAGSGEDFVTVVVPFGDMVKVDGEV